MKKIFFLLTALLLFVSASFAQFKQVSTPRVYTPTLESSFAVASEASTSQSRDVIYSEGFESAPELGLPTGWLRFTDYDPLGPTEAGDYGIWVVVSNSVNHGSTSQPGNIVGVTPYQNAYAGTKQLAFSWTAIELNAMTVSAGFSLTAGTPYTVSFWLKMPGYQSIEQNGLKVTIGQTPTYAGMNSATVVYNYTGFVANHTQVTYTYTPSVSGTYYLAFKDISVDEGLFIAIDEVKVEGAGSTANCNPPTNLNVAYASGCATAQLTWTAPAAKSLVTIGTTPRVDKTERPQKSEPQVEEFSPLRRPAHIKTTNSNVTGLPILGGTRGNTARGHKMYPDPMCYFAFDVDNILGGTPVNLNFPNVYGGDFVEGILYTYDDEGTFYKINAATGAVIQQIPGARTTYMQDMSYDYSTSTMYGIHTGLLYTINLTTGISTQVATLTSVGGTWITFAINLEGNAYAINSSTRQLYSVNKTSGACTAKGATGVSAINYAQSMAFDHNTGILYWAHSYSADDWRTVNVNTGASTKLANGYELGCLHVPYYSNQNLAGEPTNFTATPVGTSLSCNLAWTNPAVTIGGTTLTSIVKIVLERNGTTVQEFNSPTVGAAMNFTDNTMTQAGVYMYSVYAITSEGEGMRSDAIAVVGNLCQFKFAMEDDYGDGWDGGGIDIIVGGTSYGFATLFDGDYEERTFWVPAGQVEFVWEPGYWGYDDEVSFKIYNSNNEMIFECELGDAEYYYDTFFTYQNTCGGAAPSTATYNVYRDDVKINSTPVTTASYTDATFNAAAGHTWAVKAICDAGGESAAASKVMAACGGATGCNDVIVGTNQSYNGYYCPVLAYYVHSYSQFIYDAADLGAAGSITKLALQYNYSSAYNLPYITVWLGNTTKTEFATDVAAEFMPISQMQQVFNSSLTIPSGLSWATIEFTVPFEYTGGNLIVAIHAHDAPYQSSNRFYNTSTGSTHKTLQTYDDYTVIDPANPVMYNTSQRHILYRPNMKFTVCPPTPTCEPPTNLTAVYNDNCNAELTWTAPAGKANGGTRAMLWDNTAGMATNGFHSCRWSGATNERIVMADDFIVPAGETWSIDEVFFYGFPGTGSSLPEYAGIAIYADNGSDRPTTTPIYENAQLSPVGGGQVTGEMTVALSTPIQITTPGKYWISIYGSYQTAFANTKQYYLVTSLTPKEATFCRWDPSGIYGATSPYLNWTPNDQGGYVSLGFSLKGTVGGGTPPPDAGTYNVYRDGDIIATNINTTSYTDVTLNTAIGHTWDVKVACETGGLSPAATATLTACAPPPCLPVENLQAEYVSEPYGHNCKALLKWDAPAPQKVNKLVDINDPKYAFIPQYTYGEEKQDDPRSATMKTSTNAVTITKTPIERGDVPAASRGMVNVTLSANDVWEDGSGYQLLLDQTATQFGDVIPATGYLWDCDYDGDPSPNMYDVFAYKIPTNANPSCSAPNMIVTGTTTIQIPAGTYDWCITNPDPGYNRIWIAGSGGDIDARQDNFMFEDGYAYIFHMQRFGNGDGVHFTQEITGTPCPTISGLNAVQSGTSVNLTWTAAPGAPTNYQVLYENTLIATVTTTSYTHANPVPGNRNYCVKAVYPASEDCIPIGVCKPIVVNEDFGNCAGFIIGTATTAAYNMPVNTFWKYSYVQHLYTAADLAGQENKEITAIAFEYIHADPNPKDPVTIYIGHTTKSTFASTSDWVPLSQLTEVYSGPIVFNNASTWFNIPFNEPFFYEGGNLVVVVLNNNGAYNTGSDNTFRYHVASGTRTLHYYTDNSAINPLSPPTGNTSSNRSNTRFVMCPSPGTYTVYRDGDEIASLLKKRSYLDSGFDSYAPHTWDVVLVCDAGGEAPPVSVSLTPCQEVGDCDSPANLNVTYEFDCTATLDWGGAKGRDALTALTHENNGQNGVEKPQVESANEVSPNGHGDPTAPSRAWDLGNPIFSYTNIPTDGSSAVATDGQYIYVGNWQYATITRLNMNGTAAGTFTIPGISNLRGLTYDGTNFYGSSAGSQIWKLDMTNHTILETITISGGLQARYCAYDPTANSGAGGFWIGNWAGPATDAVVLISKTGAELQRFESSVTGLTGIYGATFDNLAGTPTLWTLDAAGTPPTIRQISLVTGQPTGQLLDLPAAGLSEAGGSGGGMFLARNSFGVGAALMGLVQNEKILGWEIVLPCDACPAPPTNVTATPQGTSMVCKLTWTNPATTFAGAPLSGITKMVVLRDNEIIANLSPAGVGANMSYNDVVPVAGKHNYCVYAVNAAGNGVKSCAAEVIIGALCELRFEMWDCYGDGWNGAAAINVEVNGESVGTVKLTGGLYGSQTLLAPGGELKLYWIPGSYDEECEFEVYDAEGNLLYVTYPCEEWPYGGPGDGMYGMSGLFFTGQFNCAGGSGGMYNVYRDGVLVALEHLGTTFTDFTFDPYLEHTWCVAPICPNGWEPLEPVCKTMSPCAPPPCEVEIGGGTTTSLEIPVNTYYRYSYTQQIYDASQINLPAGTEIKAITFQYIHATPNPKNPLSVYLGNTTKTTFASSSDWVPVSQMTQVFNPQAVVFNNSEPWYKITFDVPFIYDGTSNIVVAVLNNHGDYVGGSTDYTFRTHAATGKTLHYRVDGSSPINASSPPTGTGVLAVRSNIQFVVCEFEKDLAAVSISGANCQPAAGVPYTYTVDITNKGINTATDYLVQVRTSDNTIIGTAAEVPAIAPGQTLPVVVTPVNFLTPGATCIKGSVLLSGDQDPLNNSTIPYKCVTVRPNSEDEIIDIPCDPWVGTTEQQIPFNFYYKSSMVQSVYLKSEINMDGGFIKSVSWFYNATAGVSDKSVKVYLANANITSLSSAWYPEENFTLVYEGTVSVSPGTPYQLTVELPEPYLYTGGNLVVMTERLMDFEYKSGVYALVSAAPNRSRHYYSDGTAFNWTQAGSAMSYVANLELQILRVPGGEVNGTVTECETGNPLPGVEVSLGQYGLKTTTNANGEYLFPFVPANNSYTLTAIKFLYHDVIIGPFDVHENGEHKYDFCMELRPGFTVFGVVMGSDESYIEGAQLTLKGYDDRTAVAGPYGVFEFYPPVLWCDTAYTLTVTAPGWAKHTSQWIITGNTNMGTIILYDVPYMPIDVVAEEANDNFTHIYWDQSFEPPVPPYNEWIKWCVNDEIVGRVGYDEDLGENMTVAMRFTAQDLAALGVCTGHKITKIALPIGTDMYAVNSMEIRIWEGGSSIINAGTLVYTQPVTGWSSFPENMLKEIELTTPFVIDASKELRVGWNLVNTAGYPFGRDAGPVVAGKGDLFYCAAVNANWLSHYEYLGWNYNYNLKAFVSSGSKSAEIVLSTDNVPVEKPTTVTANITHNFAPYAHNVGAVAVPETVVPRNIVPHDPADGIVGYKLWRLQPGQEENEGAWSTLTNSPVPSMEYNDNTWANAAPGTYKWAVKTCYNMGIISDPAFSNVLPKYAKTTFTINLVTNDGKSPAGAVVKLTGDFEYSGTAELNSVIFHDVVVGTYNLKVTLPGYYDYSAPIEILGPGSELVTLISIVKTPSDLAVDINCDAATTTLTWNHETDATYPCTYTVYIDGEVAATGVTAKEYKFTNLAEGAHIAAVEAVYALGTSNLVYLNFIVKCEGIISYDSDGYKIYPNPADNHIFVARENTTLATIDLYNAMGMHINSYETGEQLYEINVTTLAAGTYFIRITEGTKSTVKSFVKKND